MKNAQLDDGGDLTTKYELNIEQLGPGNYVITSSGSDNDDSQGLLYETEVDLLHEEEGKLTHVSVKETTAWSDPTTSSSLEVELDSQNPERPIRTPGKMMERIY